MSDHDYRSAYIEQYLHSEARLQQIPAERKSSLELLRERSLNTCYHLARVSLFLLYNPLSPTAFNEHVQECIASCRGPASPALYKGCIYLAEWESATCHDLPQESLNFLLHCGGSAAVQLKDTMDMVRAHLGLYPEQGFNQRERAARLLTAYDRLGAQAGN